MSLTILLGTAFLEGLCVLVIEIVGARAMAPYFGGTLTVWTAQITATLLFLALGYRLGGELSRRPGSWHLPVLFGAAGLWLLLFPFLRAPLMATLSDWIGIGAGSFSSASLLFGPPLLCLGAVSPVLIGEIDRTRPGAGSAAGSLFFTNTIGGIAGGWATAFLVVPHLSVTTALTGTGLGLIGLALFWVGMRRGIGGAATGLGAAAGLAVAYQLATAPPAEPPLRMNRVVYERESSVGQLRVVDVGFAGRRAFLIDGIVQNEVNMESGRSLTPYTAYLDAMAHHFGSGAKSALVLGLGAGVVPGRLARRGLRVTAIDIDPRIEDVAREYFGMPAEVRVEIADARAFLRRHEQTYDLIVLDVFAGESGPWHLNTVEAFADMARRLNPGGRLVINTVAMAATPTMGLARMEAALLRVFPELRVFSSATAESSAEALVNVTLVAGADLAGPAAPGGADPIVRGTLEQLLPLGRDGRAEVEPATDDWSDVDYRDAEMRARWRSEALAILPST